LRGWLTSNLDWFFIGSANIFVLFCLLLIVTPMGKVRLGGKDATPDYSYIGWFAMLFAAGMGIGLMFFGVSSRSRIHRPPRLSFPEVAEGSPFARRGADRLGAHWGRWPANAQEAPAGHGRDDLPLGPAPLGDLCRRRAGAGAVQLQQGPAADHALGVLSDLRREPGAGRATSSIRWPCSRRCSVSPRRWASAPSRPMPA
jgi:hypothetical protein